jgi:hypothetical protein
VGTLGDSDRGHGRCAVGGGGRNPKDADGRGRTHVGADESTNDFFSPLHTFLVVESSTNNCTRDVRRCTTL